MPSCNRCGNQLQFVSRWQANIRRQPARGDLVACEVNFEPDRHYQESFIEIEPNIFVSVFRHACPKDEPAFPEKYKPRNLVFKGDRKRFPKKNKKQTELKF